MRKLSTAVVLTAAALASSSAPAQPAQDQSGQTTETEERRHAPQTDLIWNLIGVGVLLYVSRRFRIKPPALFALYVAWYTFGRFFEELLRIDPSHHIAGLRLNAWVSIILFLLSAGYFVWRQFFSERPHKPHEPEHRPAMAIPKSRVR